MAELDGEKNPSPDTGEADAKDGVSAEELASLLDGISGTAPLLRGLLGAQGSKSEERTRRETLLRALSPYLSPARRDAAEYLLRVWRIRDMIRQIR